MTGRTFSVSNWLYIYIYIYIICYTQFNCIHVISRDGWLMLLLMDMMDCDGQDLKKTPFVNKKFADTRFLSLHLRQLPFCEFVSCLLHGLVHLWWGGVDWCRLSTAFNWGKAAYEAVLTETTKLKTQLANHADTVEILEKDHGTPWGPMGIRAAWGLQPFQTGRRWCPKDFNL